MVVATAIANDSSSPTENVAELQFGPEFDDIHILSNAQVAVILQVSARSAVNRDEELNEVYRKTQHYVNRFNTMTNPEKVRFCVLYLFCFVCLLYYSMCYVCNLVLHCV